MNGDRYKKNAKDKKLATLLKAKSDIEKKMEKNETLTLTPGICLFIRTFLYLKLKKKHSE